MEAKASSVANAIEIRNIGATRHATSSSRCSGGSGSNLLSDYLRSIPEILMLGEILHPESVDGIKEGISLTKTLQHIKYSLNFHGQKFGGATVHLTHLEKRGLSIEVVLRQLQDPLVFILYRENVGAQYLSWKRAKVSGEWIVRGQSADVAKPSIVCDLEEMHRYRDRQNDKYTKIFKNDYIRENATVLSYESLTDDPDNVFKELVFPKLNVASSRLHTQLRKQMPTQMSEVVANWAAVEDAVLQCRISESTFRG